MQTRAWVWGSLLVALFVAAPAMAEKGDKTIRVGVSNFRPSGEYTTRESQEVRDPVFQRLTLTDSEMTLGGDSATSFFVSAEWQFTNILGIELMLGSYDVDMNGQLEERVREFDVRRPPGRLLSDTTTRSRPTGSLSVQVAMVSLYVHNRFDRFELFLGPQVGIVRYSDFVLDGETIDVSDDSPAFGWSVGGIWHLGEAKRWSAFFNVRYIKTLAESEMPNFSDSTVNIDPYIINFGAGFTF